MSEWRLLSLCVLALPVAFAGCYSSSGNGNDFSSSTGGTGSMMGGGSITTYCNTACSKAHDCDNSYDEQTCTSDCNNAYASSGDQLRNDYVTGLTNCFESKDCKTILAGTADDDCTNETLATLAPTATATSFCDQFEEAAARCDQGFDKASCLNGSKIFNDAALSNASSCFSKPCDQLTDCLTSSLGQADDGGGAGGAPGSGGTSSSGGSAGVAGTGAGGTGTGTACQEGDPSACVDASNVTVCVNTQYEVYACTDFCNAYGFMPGDCAEGACQCGDPTDQTCLLGAVGFCSCDGTCTDADVANLYVGCHIEDPNYADIACIADFVGTDTVDCDGAAAACYP